MASEQKQKLQLKKLVKELSSYRARHTELISVYVPAGYNLDLIINQLQSESGTARNIKSSKTRKNVIAALDKMIGQLRVYKKTPKNGLAIFSGNIAEEQSGQTDVKIWAIEPPEPLKLKMYKCDQNFYLEPLKEIMTPKSAYGLLVMDSKEASFAILKGKTIIPITTLKSAVPGKMRAGGQSAARFARVREGLVKDFYKKIGETANKKFAGKEIVGILVGGPGPTKEDFVNGEFLRTKVKEKVIATKNLGYTGDHGLNELVEKSEDVLAKEEVIREKQAMKKFLTLLNTDPKKVAYGEQEVKKAIEMKAVDTLLISEKVPEAKTEKLMENVEKGGGKTVIISAKIPEGEQLSGLSGFAAILRFPIS
ncbi:peptide chain release factor 1 [Candidatus Woesearchaeota archaeon]|nr:peptide chain release factor 1 [Candidatus Woesearchaeota archaeon]